MWCNGYTWLVFFYFLICFSLSSHLLAKYGARIPFSLSTELIKHSMSPFNVTHSGSLAEPSKHREISLVRMSSQFNSALGVVKPLPWRPESLASTHNFHLSVCIYSLNEGQQFMPGWYHSNTQSSTLDLLLPQSSLREIWQLSTPLFLQCYLPSLKQLLIKHLVPFLN